MTCKVCGDLIEEYSNLFICAKCEKTEDILVNNVPIGDYFTDGSS